MKRLPSRRVAADLRHVTGNRYRINILIFQELIQRRIRKRARQLFIDQNVSGSGGNVVVQLPHRTIFAEDR